MKSSNLRSESIKDFYRFGDDIGEGSFAVVKKAVRKDTNVEYAVKIVDKTMLESDDQMLLQSEVDILSQIDHPNIVKLYECYDEKTKFYMVMELMEGGELFDRIVDSQGMPEREAASIIRTVVDAVRYCHSMGIAHRDLKPENLLLSSKDPNKSIIKISDFGLARIYNNTLMSTACGTPGYLAPEVIAGGGYDLSIDYWSIGVILFVMLSAETPFSGDTNEELFNKIKGAKFNFDSPKWAEVSKEAQDLITKLLVVDPKQRLSAEGILGHPWMKKFP
eukprot:TRINITY_DN608_c0_g3_i1.p1 TRINITY_DN608_c0_g3~~TRINITY_DN608_c0_g3_i1.p1  ORF type:complete len:277 (+),score=58.21 TRINITY_DN608_c0_g3_i1:126-956(+)